MRQVALPGGAGRDGGVATVSELGFGCAGLLGRVGRTESLRALGAAANAGITLFDTARSYGYGEGEGLLGEFLAGGGRRSEVALCTKFGILPAASGGWKQRLKPLARSAVRLFPGLRAAVQRQAGTQFVPGQFSVSVLRESLEASLRALRTDYLDLLLLHGATMGVLEQTDLLEAMERLVQAGTVRAAGISGELDVVRETFRRRSGGELGVLATAQFAMNPERLGFAPEAKAGAANGMFLVGNHPFGGPAGVAATRTAVDRLRSSAGVGVALREKLAGNTEMLMPEIVLNAVLRGTGIAAVIPAMLNPEHLRGNVRAVEACRFDEQELALLRDALAMAAARTS